MKEKRKVLRLILGDQLNYRHSWFQEVDSDVTYFIAEMKSETGYVRHHIQKVIAFFAAIYNFVFWLRKRGHQVIYFQLQDAENKHNVAANIAYLTERDQYTEFHYIRPDEYRLQQELEMLCQGLTIQSKLFSDEHFLASPAFFKSIFQGKKKYLMETFYRRMRQEYAVLMEGKEPAGGKWNYDAGNREAYKGEVKIPSPLLFHRDFSSILHEIENAGIATMGSVDAKDFNWPVCRKDALQTLRYFIDHLLPHFGKYQDAMTSEHRYLFHSRLSFALNTKMLSPLEVIQAVEAAWRSGKTGADLYAVEGFIRQILGWREYMRAIYEVEMPAYASLNYFNHKNPLPRWYWTGDTKMKCLQKCITQSLETSYAHHIQRLMITGNFALLAGVDPDETDRWYLGIYIDAIEWVEITNTRGMSQFADGGIIATKPYVSSAAYISKMSNYCRTCYYDKNKRTGERSCPFNALYWNFYLEHKERLSRNPRIGMVYNTLHRFPEEEIHAIRAQASHYLKHIDEV